MLLVQLVLVQLVLVRLVLVQLVLAGAAVSMRGRVGMLLL